MVTIVKNLKITPSVNFFGRILKAEEEYSSVITRSKWPKFKNLNTEGGDSGSLMTSHISTEWNGNNATVKFQTLAFVDIIKKSKNNIFNINPCFLKPLDGDIVYSSDKKFFIVFQISNGEKCEFIGCVFENEKNEILIKKGIIHTPPIVYQENGNVNVLHRQTNGFSFVQLDTMLEMNIEKGTIDKNLIISIEQSCKQLDNETEKLTEDDSNKCKCEGTNKNLEKVDENYSLIEGGKIIKINELVEEIPVPVMWKNSLLENKSKKLVQKFKMSWIDSIERGNIEIKFNGLSGSFEGSEGKPGVIYDEKESKYLYKLIMSRPDGTFFVRSLSPESGFIMSVAPSTKCQKPDFSRLVNLYVPYGYGIRLNPCVWHSVPFPPKTTSSITLEEVICETNANVCIDLEEMCNSWFSITS